MNYAILFKLQSAIIGAIAVAFAICLGVAYVYDNQTTTDFAVAGFSVSRRVLLGPL